MATKRFYVLRDINQDEKCTGKTNEAIKEFIYTEKLKGTD